MIVRLRWFYVKGAAFDVRRSLRNTHRWTPSRADKAKANKRRLLPVSGTVATGSAKMKSSITTRSVWRLVPLVIRTLETSGLAKETPRKENVSFTPPTAGAKKVPSEAFDAPKNCSEVVFARSTSENTEPKPRVRAGVDVPGMKKLTSMMLLPKAVKRRSALNGSNKPGKLGSIFPNCVGVEVGLLASALT